MATNFETKIAINAYKCMFMIDVFVVDQSKEDIYDCNLRDVAMATKFWPK